MSLNARAILQSLTAAARSATPLETAIGLGALALGSAWLLTRAVRLASSDRLPDTGPPTSGRGRTGHLTDRFLRDVDALAKELASRGASLTGEDVLAVFLSESGVRATSKNGSGFGGLNGMGERERQTLGFTGGIDEWTALAPEEQLPFVRRFILSGVSSFAGGDFGALSGPSRLYLLNFTPAHIRKAEDFVIFRRGSAGYAQNAGMDVNGDGAIDVADVGRFLARSVTRNAAYWNEIRGRLAAARRGGTGPVVAGVTPLLLERW